jgi:hypothetical protein
MNVRPGQRAVIVIGDCIGTKVHVIAPAEAYCADMLLGQWWVCASLGGPLLAHEVQDGLGTGKKARCFQADIADVCLRPLIDPGEIETIVVDEVLHA